MRILPKAVRSFWELPSCQRSIQRPRAAVLLFALWVGRQCKGHAARPSLQRLRVLLPVLQHLP